MALVFRIKKLQQLVKEKNVSRIRNSGVLGLVGVGLVLILGSLLASCQTLNTTESETHELSRNVEYRPNGLNKAQFSLDTSVTPWQVKLEYLALSRKIEIVKTGTYQIGYATKYFQPYYKGPKTKTGEKLVDTQTKEWVIEASVPGAQAAERVKKGATVHIRVSDQQDEKPIEIQLKADGILSIDEKLATKILSGIDSIEGLGNIRVEYPQEEQGKGTILIPTPPLAGRFDLSSNPYFAQVVQMNQTLKDELKQKKLSADDDFEAFQKDDKALQVMANGLKYKFHQRMVLRVMAANGELMKKKLNVY